MPSCLEAKIGPKFYYLHFARTYTTYMYVSKYVFMRNDGEPCSKYTNNV